MVENSDERDKSQALAVCGRLETYIENCLLKNLVRLDDRPPVCVLDNHGKRVRLMLTLALDLASHADTSGLLEKHFEVLHTPV